MGFDEWWHRTKCEARGPELNKKFCSACTHKICNGQDKDDDQQGKEYSGEKIRRDAYSRAFEQHKDKQFQAKEEAEANRIKKQKENGHRKPKQGSNTRDETQEYELDVNGQQGEGEQHHSMQQDQGGTTDDEEQNQENIQTQ
eukprot:10318822-Heterocapsa_arctica.AAC.1